MKTKTLTILLVVSLTFNVFCAVGFLHAKQRRRLAHSPQGRIQLLAKRLDLTEEQCNYFKQRHQSMGSKRQAFLDELIKDKPDQKLLEKLALKRIALVQEFMRDLSPDQKQKFVEIINKRFSTGRPANAGPPEQPLVIKERKVDHEPQK